MSDPGGTPSTNNASGGNASGGNAAHADASRAGVNPKNEPSKPIDWRTLHIWQIQPVRDGLLIVAVLFLLSLGYQLRLVTVPMLLALLFAYLFEPIVRKVTRRKIMSRQGAAVGVIFGALLVIAVPVGLAIGFGALQGAAYIQQQASNVRTLWQSVESPQDERLVKMLPSENWRRLRHTLIDLRRESERVRAEREWNKGEGADDKSPKPHAPAPVVPAPSPDGSTSPSAGAGSGVPTTSTPDAPSGVKPAKPAVPDTSSSATGDSNQRPSPSAVFMYQIIEWVAEQVQNKGGAVSEAFVQTGAGALGTGLDVLGHMGMLGFGAFLTAFFFYYFCTHFERVLLFFHNLLPEKTRPDIVRLIGRMDTAISGFVRGRLLICAIMMVYFTLAYLAIGIRVPLVLGPIVGLLTLIPYASSLGIPIAMLLMFLQPGWMPWQDEWWWIVGGPILVYVISQVGDDYFLTPRIQGPNTGMDTPTILFASLAGGVLAGFYGLLIAIPVAACVKIMMQDVVWPRYKAWREGKVSDPLPIAKP